MILSKIFTFVWHQNYVEDWLLSFYMRYCPGKHIATAVIVSIVVWCRMLCFSLSYACIRHLALCDLTCHIYIYT